MAYEAPAYHTVCFLCQSAAEKLLKGYLVAQGWTLKKTHDIVELLGLCADHDTQLGAMIDEGAILNEYIIVGRYPEDINFERIGRVEAEEALEAVRRIQARIKDLMDAA
jgi:HEPN domain-containing protein